MSGSCTVYIRGKQVSRRARKAATSFGTSYMSFNTYKIDA